MGKYQFRQEELALIENCCVPYAVYQFVDQRVVTLALSAGFMELFDFTDRAFAYDLMDRDMYRDTHPDDISSIADAALKFARNQAEYNVVYRSKVRGEYRIIHAQAKHVYVEQDVRLAYVWYTDEGPCTGRGEIDENYLNRDFMLSLHQEGMYREMNYDFLTGLPSMTYFFQLADAGRRIMQEAGEQSAILFADLNGMKFFNLKYGFAEGDQLISAFAKILVKYFSNENCSRFGQDHFAVYTRAEGLEEKLQMIFKECETMNGGRTLPVKIGIYLDSMGVIETSLACDRAKYACNKKRQDYHSYFNYVSEEMLSTERNRQYVLDNLDRALQENWIKAYYQPIVRAANDRVCDEEALVRWMDPVRGMISPADFVPILEDTKLIYKIDLRMVELVLDKMKRQAEEGLYLVPISVNLSRYDFEVCDIVEEIRRRVDASGIGRDKLVIEITESVIGNDFDFMKSQIERFQSLGFKVWMDDFGSGYSSLDVLKDVHFDLIKFDMRFMRGFNDGEKGEKGKVILAELIKMAMALGIETVTEGVETKEQMEFLREVGCTKLQGYYFCKPVPLEEILERYRKGTQIGFENPDEVNYYESIGRINLYDLAVVSNEDSRSLMHFFDTLPMSIVETDGEWIRIPRCNKGYWDFMERYFGALQMGAKSKHVLSEDGAGSAFLKAVKQCRKDGKKVFFSEFTREGTNIHAFVRRIAVNPVTGVAACAVVVLGITNENEQGVTYTHVARALSADYFNLYLVNMDTDRFIEFRPDVESSDLAVERNGIDFFHESRKDALQFIFEDDREDFLAAFTKEKMEQSLAENGTFTLSYRLLVKDVVTYVNMKAVRLQKGGNQVIIGVNNVDAQMRQQEALDRIRAEQATFERISILAGNIICIYTVNPETGHYLEYAVTNEYEKLGLGKEGEDFFGQSLAQIGNVICPAELELFKRDFSKEQVLQKVNEGGLFLLNYHLMIEGKSVPVCLRAGIVEEKDGCQLIVGISKQN